VTAIAAAANALNSAPTKSVTPASGTPSGGTGNGNDDDKSDSSDPAAAALPAAQPQSAAAPSQPAASSSQPTAAAPPQPTASPSQPAAAAFVLGTTLNAAPATANPAETATAISASTKFRGKAAAEPLLGDSNAPIAHDAKADAGAQPTMRTSQSQADGNAGTASSADQTSPASTDNAAASTGAAPQPQAQADNNATVLVGRAETTFQAGMEPGVARSGAIAAIAAPNVAGLSTAPGASASAAANALPNFGFSAVNGSAPSAAGSGSASAAGVPIAGLPVAITARAQAGSNQFDIRLDPPELGRIDVRLDVDRNGQVTSHVTVDRADTLQLLQSQQPQLERALEQAGLKTADNGLQFTLRDQSFAGQNGNSGGQPSTTAQLVIPDAGLAPVDTTQIYSRWNLGSGVDIRV
jgi:flagellar hook-length control protein FliK